MRLHPPETSKSDDCTADNDRKRKHNSKGTKVRAGWDVDVHARPASGYVHGHVCDSDDRQHDKGLVHGVFGHFGLDTEVCEIGGLRV